MNMAPLIILPLLITIAVLPVLSMGLSLPLQGLAVLIVAVSWSISLFRLSHYRNDYLNIVERINQLKSFSGESQQLINRELALVQEDVARIKCIVSDSINLLQTSFSHIQKDVSSYIKVITHINNHNQSSQHAISVERLSKAKHSVEGVLKKVNVAVATIESMDEVSHRVALLAANSSVEAAQVSSSTGRHTANVAYQIDCIARQSSGLSDTIRDSAAYVSSALDEINSINDELLANSVVSIPTDISEKMKKMDTHQSITENLSSAIRALQFEDMITQITERVVSHVGDIRVIVEMLSRLYETELSDTFEQDLKAMDSELEKIKKNLLKAPANKVVAQKSMDEGNVELF